jgi:hypothetical protein
MAIYSLRFCTNAGQSAFIAIGISPEKGGVGLANGLAAVVVGHPEMWRRAEAHRIEIAVALKLVRYTACNSVTDWRTGMTNSTVAVRPLIIR